MSETQSRGCRSRIDLRSAEKSRNEDIQKSTLPPFSFAVFSAEFFAPSREALRGCPSCQPGGSCQGCPLAPSPSQWSLGRLSKTLRKKTELRLRASLQSKVFRVCLLLFLRLVWPLMQILFTSLFNNKWGFFGRFSRSGH